MLYVDDSLAMSVKLHHIHLVAHISADNNAYPQLEWKLSNKMHSVAYCMHTDWVRLLSVYYSQSLRSFLLFLGMSTW